MGGFGTTDQYPANLHTDLVKEFGSAGSGFAGGNAKLQDYIASRVQPERATVYKEQIQSMKTAQVATDKKGMVLKKDEVAQAERGEKNALNGVWIAGGVFALFVILLLVLKKKEKGIKYRYGISYQYTYLIYPGQLPVEA